MCTNLEIYNNCQVYDDFFFYFAKEIKQIAKYKSNKFSLKNCSYLFYFS